MPQREVGLMIPTVNQTVLMKALWGSKARPDTQGGGEIMVSLTVIWKTSHLKRFHVYVCVCYKCEIDLTD